MPEERKIIKSKEMSAHPSCCWFLKDRGIFMPLQAAHWNLSKILSYEASC